MLRDIAVGEIEMRKKTEASDVVISHLSWQGEDILDAGDISASNWSVSRVDYDLVEGADMSMSRIEAGSKTILADMSLNTAFEIVPQLLDQEPVAFDMYADDLSEFDLSSAQAPQVVEDDFDLNFELPDDLPIFQQENNGQMAFVM